MDTMLENIYGKELAEAVYDDLASVYDQHFVNPVSLAENHIVFQYLKYLSSFLEPGYKILDAGCGTGLFLDYNKHISPNNYIGVDISQKMLNVAQKKYPSYYWIKGDMRRLPRMVRSQSIDLYISLFGSISYIKEITYVLHEMYRVLKPGGRFFLMFCGPPYPTRDSYIPNSKKIVEQPPLYTYTHGNLKKMFPNATIKGFNSLGDPKIQNMEDGIGSLLWDYFLKDENEDSYWFIVTGEIEK